MSYHKQHECHTISSMNTILWKVWMSYHFWCVYHTLIVVWKSYRFWYAQCKQWNHTFFGMNLTPPFLLCGAVDIVLGGKKCKCRSTTHQRISHSECPLNKKRQTSSQLMYKELSSAIYIAVKCWAHFAITQNKYQVVQEFSSIYGLWLAT